MFQLESWSENSFLWTVKLLVVSVIPQFMFQLESWSENSFLWTVKLLVVSVL